MCGNRTFIGYVVLWLAVAGAVAAQTPPSSFAPADAAASPPVLTASPVHGAG